MPKKSRGGQYSPTGGGGGIAGAPKVTPTQVTPPTPQQIASGNVLPKGGVSYSSFQNMSDDDKADVITSALGVGTPMFLDNSGLQKFAYYTGMSDKPSTVTDSQLDKTRGTELFRTVNNAYNSSTDIGYTANDIYKQIKDGDFTMYSDSGGSAYGKGIYFANTFGGSAVYGNGRGSIVMRAKITGGKEISHSRLHSQYRAALSRGDKLALACSNADHASAANLYGLAKGYTHVNAGSYFLVLNRGCLTMSDKTKAARGSSW